MRTSCLLVGFAFAASTAVAQSRPAADTIPATGGQIVISPIAHGTVHLKHGATVILVDPTTYGGWDGAPTGGRVDYSGLEPPNLILVTDTHGDHFDPDALVKLKASGGKVAVPMYNLQRGPSAATRFHDKGRGNGYVVTLGGKRIYISGDTECTPEMKALKNIDIAFIAMNLPYPQRQPIADPSTRHPHRKRRG